LQKQAKYLILEIIVKKMELENVKIYRMTHIENIPHILQYGVTHRNSPNANPNFVTIGDLSLIDTRSNKVVNVDNGNFLDFDVSTIILGNFIPFYFGIKMPMLYVMQNGGNFVEKATPAQDIIYLACSLINIVHSKTTYYFSDGHAIDNLTSFYDISKIQDLPTLIDWNAVKASYWGGQDNLNLKRKKQAEFLTLNDLPPDLIIGFVCYNNIAKQALINMGIQENKIKIIPTAYY
jgi:ssDNA thymidine ADP-ribosyltransferase, DarT